MLQRGPFAGMLQDVDLELGHASLPAALRAGDTVHGRVVRAGRQLVVKISSVASSDVWLKKSERVIPVLSRVGVLRVSPPCGSGPGDMLAGFTLWMPLGLWNRPTVSFRSGVSSSPDSPASQELWLGRFCIFKAIGDAAS